MTQYEEWPKERLIWLIKRQFAWLENYKLQNNRYGIDSCKSVVRELLAELRVRGVK